MPFCEWLVALVVVLLVAVGGCGWLAVAGWFWLVGVGCLWLWLVVWCWCWLCLVRVGWLVQLGWQLVDLWSRCCLCVGERNK